MNNSREIGLCSACRTYGVYLFVAILGFLTAYSLSDFAWNVKYPLTPDGAGYLWDAKNILDGNGVSRPVRDLGALGADMSATAFHPPGFGLLVALVSSMLDVSVLEAAKLVVLSAWALIWPCMVFALRPVVGVLRSVVIGLLVVISPSVYSFGPSILSDTSTLVVILISFGLLSRGVLRDRGLAAVVFSGLLVGIAYVMRNSAISYMSASLAALILLAGSPGVDKKKTAGHFLAYLTPVLLVVGALLVRNAIVFDSPQPWGSLSGGNASLFSSFRVLVEGVMVDVYGSEWLGKEVAWSWPYLLTASIAALIFSSVVLWAAWSRGSRQERLFVYLAVFYVTASAIMLVMAHAFHGLDPGYLVRHVMPFGWAIFGLVFVGVDLLFEGRSHRIAELIIYATIIVSVLFRFDYIYNDIKINGLIWDEFGKESVVGVAVDKSSIDIKDYTIPVLHIMSRDVKSIDMVKDLPENAYIVSNASYDQNWWVQRPMRLAVKVRGNAEFSALWVRLCEVSESLNGSRPVFMVVYPIHYDVIRSNLAAEWQERFIASLPLYMSVYNRTSNILILKVQYPCKI